MSEDKSILIQYEILGSIFYDGVLPENFIVINNLDLGTRRPYTFEQTQTSEIYWNLSGNNLYPKSSAYNVVINATSTVYDEKLTVVGSELLTGSLYLNTNQVKLYNGGNNLVVSILSNVSAIFESTSLKSGNNTWILSNTNSSSSPSYTFANNTSTGMFLPGTNALGFTAGGLYVLGIDSSGKVIINVTPSDDVSGSYKALVYNTSTKEIMLRSLSDIHTHSNKSVLDALSSSGGKLYYNGVLVTDLSNYYTIAEVDNIVLNLENTISTKADINHNHSLANLTEKSYNSLTDKPNLSSLHSHTNKDTLDRIPDYLGASEGQLLIRSGGGISWGYLNIDNLDDVVITSVQDGQVLSYDSVTSKWINKTISEVSLVSDILYWNSANSKYTAYSSKQSSLVHFYLGTTNPDNTTRLNLDAYLYATRLYSNGIEVSVIGHTHNYIPLISTPISGNFPVINTSGGIDNSIYSPSSFALANHDHNTLYYTQTQLQTSGQSSVHWDNITNKPTFTLNINSDILYWDSANSKYTPYSSKQSSLVHFYLGTTNPDNTTRLNLDAYLYVTKLHSNGIINAGGINVPNYFETNSTYFANYSFKNLAIQDSSGRCVWITPDTIYKSNEVSSVDAYPLCILGSQNNNSSYKAGDVIISGGGNNSNSNLDGEIILGRAGNTRPLFQATSFDYILYYDLVNHTVRYGSASNAGKTPVSDILYWNSANSKYTAYSSKQSSLVHFYLGITDPDNTTRLNLDAYLYATKLYSNGTEVSVITHDHNTLYYTQTQLQTSGQSQVHWNNITNKPGLITTSSDLIFDNGNKTISIAAPSSPGNGSDLTVAGGTQSGTNTGGKLILIGGNGYTGGSVYIYGYAGITAGNVYIQHTGNTAVNGNIYIGTNTGNQKLNVAGNIGCYSIIPISTVSYDLGSNSYKWRDVYIAGTLSSGHIIPYSNNLYDLGSSSYYFRTLYTNNINNIYVTTNSIPFLSRVLDRTNSATNVSNTNAENDVYSYTVTAGLLGNTGTIRMIIGGLITNNSGSSTNITVKTYFGGTVVHADASLSLSSSTTTRAFFIQVYFHNNTTSSQVITGSIQLANANTATTGYGDLGGNASLSNPILGLASIDTSSSVIVKVTFTMSTANSGFYWQRMFGMVELL